MAPQRNYYADLELPMTADVTEIKKQFRKLGVQRFQSIVQVCLLDEIIA
jgi:hypothetical protein